MHKYKPGKIFDFSIASKPKELFNKIKSTKVKLQKELINLKNTHTHARAHTHTHKTVANFNKCFP